MCTYHIRKSTVHTDIHTNVLRIHTLQHNIPYLFNINIVPSLSFRTCIIVQKSLAFIGNIPIVYIYIVIIHSFYTTTTKNNNELVYTVCIIVYNIHLLQYDDN